jgi:UDP-N-acetylmuramate: L-alanyl-gamma-D-glutamyl-meso-diaminopimelate ligase
MSLLLERAGIRPFLGFDPSHLEPPPDLVIVGNAVHRNNVEAVAAEAKGLPRLSMPEALARFFLADRRPLVVAGTHGKTTSTALAAWSLVSAGKDPGFLVGGLPLNLEESFRKGQGPCFVIEGDEYNAAYFDRGPKFLHYRPESVLWTSLEHDHVDLYPTFEALERAFSQLVELVPSAGTLVAWADSESVVRLLPRSRGRVVTYGFSPQADVQILETPRVIPSGMAFELRDLDGTAYELELGVWGTQNVLNATGVWTLLRAAEGLPPRVLATSFRSFRGVARRQQLLGEVGGITVLDDFAHHPTAVFRTIEAVRDRFPGHRILVAFEPRSSTAGRAFLRGAYLQAFSSAAVVVLAPLFHRDRLPPEDRLDTAALAADLTSRGIRATACASLDEVEAVLVNEARPGDAVVFMSSGSFGGLPHRLLNIWRGQSLPGTC